MKRNQVCTFHLFRHGETAWNQQGIAQGHTDIALSSVGEKQAKTCAESLQGAPFAAAFSSDLSRARQTALILTKEHKIPLQTTSLLREQSWGPWEGKPFDLMRQQFGSEFNAYTGNEAHRVPGVESHRQVVCRVEPFLHETAAAFLGKSVLVVTHGGVLKGLIYHLGIEAFFNARFHNLGSIKVQSDGHKLTFIEAAGLYSPVVNHGV